MLRVLAVTDYFLPGSNAGGPIRTLTNLAAQLACEVELSVLTRDRDYSDHAPYAGVEADAWTAWGTMPVRYLSPRAQGLAGLRRAIASRPHDVLWLNSVFSTFTRRILTLRRLGQLEPRPVVVAPRGELSPGPLGMKRGKKRAYLAAARAAGLFRGVTWQATSEMERGEILDAFPGARVEVAPNPTLPASASADGPPAKEKGSARFVFLSRISEKKNLLDAVRALSAAPGPAVLDVYGNLEDAAYWERCRRAADDLPAHVTVEYRGKVPFEAVEETLAGYHFFLLPTRGENFGHVVVEALRAGLPVLVSDRTPWRGLEAAQAGWDVPLDDLGALREKVRTCVEMDGETYRAWSAAARRYAESAAPADAAREPTLQLFRRAAASASQRAAVGGTAASARAG
jgi:glycosyltransferase involved in cell wall biosynthesis